MLRHLLPLIPEHQLYVEPFFGGGSLLFAKQPARCEVINDKLDIVANFWQILKTDFPALKKQIRATLHTESACRRSRNILKAPGRHDPVTIAWAFWAQTQLTFSHMVYGGFAFAKNGVAMRTANKIKIFTHQYADRLKNTQIFNRDALDIICRFDSPDTFFYFDPPYAESDCGHYDAGKDVYYKLLKLLPTLKGRWLLSSYPSPELDALRQTVHANTKDIVKPLAVSGKHNAGKTKVECLTYNYPTPDPA
jgi:DNA adenine methylase